LGAAKMIDKTKYNCRFAILGGVDKDNPGYIDEAEFQRCAEDAGVEWWGHIEDMSAAYLNSTIVCLPSYREGLPKALLEAASCGKPLIATDVPGCRDICIHEQTGLLVLPKDTNSLADAITRMLSDPKLRKSCGAAARRLVEERFSLEAIVVETDQYYRSLLEARH
ncbi:MAG: glycosyltransferase, partial [Pseudomonadota bacterium]